MLDNSNIETTDWLIKGIGEKQLQKEKEKALKKNARINARIQKKRVRVKLDCCFDECKDCIYREHSDDLLCCAASMLGLARHRLIKELPIINRFIDDDYHCNWYQKEE